MQSKIYFGLLTLLTFNVNAQLLTLSAAEDLALQSDPATLKYRAQQASFKAQGISQSQLKDPMVRFGLGNVPIDSLSLTDDPMTQFNVGLSQQFSRGDTLALNAESFSLQTKKSIEHTANRQLELKRIVREIWLDIQMAQVGQKIVATNQTLFRQNIANLYSQFELGYKQNQDLISAELELAKFDEKIAAFAQQEQALRGQLFAWIGPLALEPLAPELPEWKNTRDYTKQGNLEHYQLIANHPQVLAAQQAIDIADNSIQIANQSYKPAFKIELGYGRREASEMTGAKRSDLVSGFITMNIPLFTDKRQDQTVIAATQKKGMKRADKDLLMIRFNGMLNGAIANFLNIQSRMQRYQKTLLNQAKLNTEASVQGYQVNTNNFEQVIEAFMDEQSLALEFHQLHFQSLKTLARIRYFQAL